MTIREPAAPHGEADRTEADADTAAFLSRLRPAPEELRTPRLILRRWRPEDRAPFAAMNADPEVMRFFDRPLTREESDAAVDRFDAHFARYGFGFWALEVPGITPFAGFVGIAVPRLPDLPFLPAVEIGWRLSRPEWGKGYATEAARAALAAGFESVGLDEIVAYAVAGNLRSRAVMERIGMTHDPADDFVHSLTGEAPRRQFVLYRIRRERADG